MDVCANAPCTLLTDIAAEVSRARQRAYLHVVGTEWRLAALSHQLLSHLAYLQLQARLARENVGMRGLRNKSGGVSDD